MPEGTPGSGGGTVDGPTIRLYQPKQQQITEFYSGPMGATTAGASVGGHPVAGLPVIETGTYRIKGHFRVGNVTASPTAVEVRATSTQALLAVAKVGGATRTLYAANAVIATHTKGSTYVTGDYLTFESADIALTAGEFIRADGNASMFQMKCNGSSAVVGLNGAAFYLEMQ